MMTIIHNRFNNVENKQQMIKALLNNKPMTFQELHTRLTNSHTKDSLNIELEFLMSIGKIIKVKENYKLLK